MCLLSNSICILLQNCRWIFSIEEENENNFDVDIVNTVDIGKKWAMLKNYLTMTTFLKNLSCECKMRLKGTCVLIPSSLLMLMTLSQYFLSSLEDCAWREHWITLFWVHQLNEGQGKFYFLRRNVMLFPIDTFQVNVIVTFNRSHETTTIHLFQKF